MKRNSASSSRKGEINCATNKLLSYNKFSFRRRQALLKLREEERNFNLEKIQNLQHERIQRVAELRRSVEIFSSLDAEHKIAKNAEKITQNWNSLFQSDRIRDASKSPQALRDLLAILEIESEEFEAENLNWWLKCDEFSLLTQVMIPDTRRTVMRDGFREMKEKFFKQQINDLMSINDRLAAIIERKVVIENENSVQLREFFQVISDSFFLYDFMIIKTLHSHPKDQTN